MVMDVNEHFQVSNIHVLVFIVLSVFTKCTKQTKYIGWLMWSFQWVCGFCGCGYMDNKKVKE